VRKEGIWLEVLAIQAIYAAFITKLRVDIEEVCLALIP